jgi:hypothetical protein
MSKDSLNYGMLGEDHASTADKLAKYTGEVDWGYLRPHFESGVLFFVDPDLKLETVAESITADNKPQVDAWLKAGDLVKIEALHAAQWEETETQFRALVVSPFVLFQPLEANQAPDKPQT